MVDRLHYAARTLKTYGVYHTWSDLEGVGQIHYHFSNGAGTPMTPAMVHLDDRDAGKYAVRNWYTGDVSLLDANGTALAAGYEGHVYATVSPVGNGGWIFLGEVDKRLNGQSIGS